jgi:plasmid maintenance system antidote protein VapI
MSKQRRITEGGRQLRAYLKRVGQTVPEFAEAHGLDRIQVQRVLKGDRERISVDFALAIEKATDGTVQPWMFSKSTLRPADELPATGT